jgi:ribosomal 50S subunit-recycling heat shock protein
MDLSSIRLFSRRSSARQTHNQQRILYNKQRSTQANPTWGGEERGFSMGTA